MWRCRHATKAAPPPPRLSRLPHAPTPSDCTAHEIAFHYESGVAPSQSPPPPPSFSTRSDVASHQATSSTMTAKNKKPSEPRRANKPLMEKRRRARINQSLAALKTLILDTAKADNTKHSKLEKADILELTVRHFQRHRSLDVQGVSQYKAGYTDCVREVQRYLETPDAQTMTIVDTGVRQRLLRHLDNCVAEVDVDLRQAGAPPQPPVEERLQPPDTSSLVKEVNNNHTNTSRLPEAPSEEPSPSKQKSYDGNYVLLLPEHYVQLASALGVNLRPQNDSDSNPSTSSEKLDGEVKRIETPLDFSGKSNDLADMWRPW